MSAERDLHLSAHQLGTLLAQPSKTLRPPGRHRCACHCGCTAILSRYSDDPTCWPCTRHQPAADATGSVAPLHTTQGE